MNEIKRTIQLMHKTQTRPLLFQILHSHLAFLISKRRVDYSWDADIWEKVLIMSIDDSKYSKTMIENKILSHLKSSRSQNSENIYRLRIVLFYLDNVCSAKINIFILFEIVSNHFGGCVYNDCLVEKIVLAHLNAERFNMKPLKILTKEIVASKMLKTHGCSYKKLSIFAFFEIQPPRIIAPSTLIHLVKTVEAAAFYAKFTADVKFFKQALPESELFIEKFKGFVKNEPAFSGCACEFQWVLFFSNEKSGIANLKMRIKEAFERSGQAEGFKRELVRFLEEL